VFLSSHLLAEVAHSADDAVIIDRGRLVQAGPVADLATGPSAVVVTSLDADPLAVALARSGGGVQRTGPDQLTVTGLDPEAIGRTAVAVGAAITGMSRQSDDLESVFQNLIHPQALSAGAGRLSQKVTS
jgi:ABC-2 type transport system ATP-binding protein